jgi:hypothetical protein
MKSMDIKRIGTLAASTLMLGAALAGPVSAAMDATGLTKGFFYDANMKPVVQIVVGEKGLASDAVAAGNIAATIGNLAYMTETVTTGAEGDVEGQVVISTESTMAVGDYVQDTNVDNYLPAYSSSSENLGWFYDDSKGLYFDDTKTYEKGDFTIYNIACAQQTRAEAGILTEAEYKNVYCLFCETLCQEGLEFDVTHEMKESIFVNSSKIRYYEEGIASYDKEDLKMAIDANAIRYRVETGYIPMEKITDSSDTEIDFEYRGKIILFGEEYYVRDIKSPRSSSAKIYLAKGKVLDDISSEGYTAEYNGYKFKIDHLIYSAEYVVAGILLDVQKPDGTVVQVQVSKMANGQVDDLEIAGVTAEESAAVATGSILVYDKSTEVVLQNNKDLVLDGEEKKYWRVTFHSGTCDALGCGSDISEYDGTTGYVLDYIDVTYRRNLDGNYALGEDESLAFPNNFVLTFKGYMDSNDVKSPCSGANEGNIKLERGDYDWQLLISFTGEDNNRYDNVRLDEGPFIPDELFMLNGELYKYVKAEEYNDSRYEVTIDPVISGTRKRIYVDKFEALGITTDANTRFLALVDAIDDSTSNRNEKDNNETISYEDLYASSSAAVGSAYVVYNDVDGTILLATGLTDNKVEVNPTIAMGGESGYFDKFQVDDNSLKMYLVKEDGTDGSLSYRDDRDYGTGSTCATATVVSNHASYGWYNKSYDINCDGDDEDVLVKFVNTDGEVVYLDFMDRNYDEALNGYYYDNNVFFDIDASGDYNSTVDKKIDKDEDTVLITPEGGDVVTIDWGTDYLIEAVDFCKPQDQVDATYFIGTEEKESTLNETITKADVGTNVEAGCCVFYVADFNVAGTGGGEATVTTEKVTKMSLEDLGKLVVPESVADEDKSLILVGGPVVNGMTEAAGITADDIAAEPDKYLVKKVDNKLVVAGWEKEHTINAGNALIAWLQDNIHA